MPSAAPGGRCPVASRGNTRAYLSFFALIYPQNMSIFFFFNHIPCCLAREYVFVILLYLYEPILHTRLPPNASPSELIGTVVEFFSKSHIELIRIQGSHTNLTLIAPLLHNTPIDLFKSTGTELDKCSKFLRCMWRLKGQWGSKQVVREQRRMELLSEQKILCLCKKLCVIIPKKANVTVTAIVRSPPFVKCPKSIVFS